MIDLFGALVMSTATMLAPPPVNFHRLIVDYKDQRYLVTNDLIDGTNVIDMKSVSKRNVLVLHDVVSMMTNEPPPDTPVIRGGPEFHRPEDGCLGLIFIFGLTAFSWGLIGVLIFGRTYFMAGLVLAGIGAAGMVMVHYFATKPQEEPKKKIPPPPPPPPPLPEPIPLTDEQKFSWPEIFKLFKSIERRWAAIADKHKPLVADERYRQEMWSLFSTMQDPDHRYQRLIDSADQTTINELILMIGSNRLYAQSYACWWLHAILLKRPETLIWLTDDHFVSCVVAITGTDSDQLSDKLTGILHFLAKQLDGRSRDFLNLLLNIHMRNVDDGNADTDFQRNVDYFITVFGELTEPSTDFQKEILRQCKESIEIRRKEQEKKSKRRPGKLEEES